MSKVDSAQRATVSRNSLTKIKTRRLSHEALFDKASCILRAHRRTLRHFHLDFGRFRLRAHPISHCGSNDRIALFLPHFHHWIDLGMLSCKSVKYGRSDGPSVWHRGNASGSPGYATLPKKESLVFGAVAPGFIKCTLDRTHADPLRGQSEFRLFPHHGGASRHQ